MKIKYKESILKQVDYYIGDAISNQKPIEYIGLTQHEYIQFLEEIDPVDRVLLTMPERLYRKVPIKVTY